MPHTTTWQARQEHTDHTIGKVEDNQGRVDALSVASQVLVRGLGGSGKPSSGRVLQRLRVGVLAGLNKDSQVEVARDERGGLQGQRAPGSAG